MNHPVNERQSPPIPLPPTDEQQLWLTGVIIEQRKPVLVRSPANAKRRSLKYSRPLLVTVGLWGHVRSEASQVLRFLPPPFSSPPPFPRYATAANGLDPKVKKSGTFISLM